ncbi:uncharacterized protein LOC128193163 isoform X3 [Crassostrea angulata]|uniref:uncharacterized protein LOC128193163 isoform X3 n=1 Tax=Magallana angulata TaxID=2784310 RepID=UPI0022B1D0AD|nr:uncharacterized protein LOC128193163 isoform X3 [Crassostrea angulata]
MTSAFVCAILLSVRLLASAQNIQIQALPPTVNYGENDLVIVCSITNPSQLAAVYFIELQRNSSTLFDGVVSVVTGQTSPIQWKDFALRNRASATASIDPPSTAQLRLTIDKNSVQCPSDFKMYMCRMSGFSSIASEAVTQETSPIIISYIVKPAVIEVPRVKILNELYDTPDRQFPVGTAITLTCQGQVGSDGSNTIRWCAQKTNEIMFTGLPQTPINSEASLSGCQYTRSSTITYNLTSQDTFTKFLCESGDTGLCGTGTAIQYVNISTTVTEGSSTTSAPSTDDLSPSPSIPTTDASIQNIHIQAFPQTVNYRENDLVLVCSIINPSQLNAVYNIELQKNSSTTFETIVSVATGQTPSVQWKDFALRNRATATGNIDSPSTAQLRLSIDKTSVQCPNDFKMYMCKFSGYNSYSEKSVTQETSPITISYIVKPAVIEMPRVKILNELYDTPDRQFPVGTAITLTCQGQVGSDKSNTIRWCTQKTNEMMFTGLPQTPIHSEASLSGCQYTRSSTITYNLTRDDTFTRFMCESGDTGLCGTGTAIQYVNISTTVTEGSSTTSAPSTDDLSPSPSIPTTDASIQNLHIQAFPQTVNYKENDLVIVCSIINPSQLNAVYNIELQKNSSTTFETIVSVATGQTPSVQWKDSALRNRATATGNIDSPSTAQLRLSIDKTSVQCPNDFKMYMCKFSGYNSYSEKSVTQETSPITISYIVKPAVIELPRVKILNELYDTPDRQFPVGTAITLTCQGQVGSDKSNTVRWCAKRVSEFSFTGLAQTPIHSEASLSGCQYTRSSTITYKLNDVDTFTQLLCESGYSGLCGTGTAIQYVNISITVTEGSSTTSAPSTDEESSTINSPTTNDTSENNDTLTTDGTSASGTIAGEATVLVLLILLVV